MSVYLNRSYNGFPASSTAEVMFPDNVEASLIAQGIAVAARTTNSWPGLMGAASSYCTQGGNVALMPQAGFTTPTYPQGPLRYPNAPIGDIALTGYETNGVATAVAGTWYYAEIIVPYLNTWTGIGILNGTTVGTDNHIVALFGSNGTLLANSATAGAVTANTSVFQNRAFTSTILLIPGRYFLAVQSNGTTDTIRHFVTGFGVNVTTGSQTGTFGTIPSSITTVSSTFTTAVGPIAQLYV